MPLFVGLLSVLQGAGVALLEGITICIDTITNEVMARDLQMVKKNVEQGKNLSEPIKKIPYFPDMLIQMMKVGEQTGQIDNMLENIANVFEDEVNMSVNTMTKMIEPIVIVVLGSIIAFIMVAMYLPMFMSAGGAGV